MLAADPSVRVDARAHKMSKARGNVINPDAIVAEYGADSLRLYEMFMGPLEAVKPWSMKGVEGVYRFLGRAWRMIVDAEADVVRLDPRVKPVDLSPEQAKVVARTIAAVTDDLEALPVQHGHQPLDGVRQLLHRRRKFGPRRRWKPSRSCLAPMAPHMAEELWSLLGHEKTLAYEPWPEFDPALLKDDEVEIPGPDQRQAARPGRRRGRGATVALIEQTARDDPKIAVLLEGKTVRKVVVVPGKLVNFVVEAMRNELGRVISSGSTWGRPTARSRMSTRTAASGRRPTSAISRCRNWSRRRRPRRGRCCRRSSICRASTSCPRRDPAALERGVRPHRRRVCPVAGGEGAQPAGQ